MEDTTLGRQRVVIENIRPRADERFAVKRVAGDRVTVEADAFADGHDHIVVLLLHRKAGDATWIETPMESIFNDRYRASFAVEELGRYQYTIEAWVDRFHTWRYDLTKRAAAGQDLASDLLIGAEMVERAANRAQGKRCPRTDARGRPTSGRRGSKTTARDRTGTAADIGDGSQRRSQPGDDAQAGAGNYRRSPASTV